jgi:hypothetical protein
MPTECLGPPIGNHMRILTINDDLNRAHSDRVHRKILRRASAHAFRRPPAVTMLRDRLTIATDCRHGRGTRSAGVAVTRYPVLCERRRVGDRGFQAANNPRPGRNQCWCARRRLDDRKSVISDGELVHREGVETIVEQEGSDRGWHVLRRCAADHRVLPLTFRVDPGARCTVWFDVFIDVAMSYQASVVSARREVPVMNRLAGLWSLGTVSGGLVSIAVARANIGPAVHFLGFSLMLIGALAFVAPGLLPLDEPHPEQQAAELVQGRFGRRFSTPAIALGFANAMAVTLDITSGDWATFRLTDDLNATASVAVVAFVAFTAGMTIGRMSGDFVLVRVGRVRLAQLGASTSGVGLIIATLIPNRPLAIAGFAISGLGTSILGPQLADAAARAPGPPGSGFKTLFVGHRAAALLVPIAIGTLANTSSISVGGAMAIIGIPTAIVLAATAHSAVGGSAESGAHSGRNR